MHRSESFPPPFRLNQWLVQPDRNRIEGPDGAAGVEPRVMKVLLVLAEHGGEVVARDDLLDAVWGDAVVGEESLTRAVSELRRIFGDNARRPETIETIRQRGYRLIPSVMPAEVTPVPDPPAAEPDPEPEPVPVPKAEPVPQPVHSIHPEDPGRAQGIPRSVYLVAACLILLGIVFGPRLLRTGPGEQESVSPSVVPQPAVPLTSFPGREWHPALSHDGTRVAFIWAGPDGDNADLYVKQRNSETPLRLTEDPRWAAWPAWSPDGQTLAYIQGSDSGSVVCLIPTLGGAIREIHHSPGLIEGIDWSPDGKTLALSARGKTVSFHTIQLLSLDDFAARPLPVERYGHAGMFQPRFSPDGTRVAWVGLGPAGRSGIFRADLDSGEYQRVMEGHAPIQGLAWTSDGQFLIYGSAPNDRYNLWKVPAEGGAPQWIPTSGDFALNPSVARETGDLVFEEVRINQDLWRVEILGRDPWELGTSPFVTSTRWDNEADFHPAGDRVVFVSARSGYSELWVCGADGSDPRQVTNLRAGAIHNPRWAHGGDRIAFNVVFNGEPRVMVVQSLGGQAREVPVGDRHLVFSSWSADDATLLVGAEKEGIWQIHRLSQDGGLGESLTRGGGVTAIEDPAGNALYFTRPSDRGLWRLDRANKSGEPELILSDLAPENSRHWRLVADHSGVTGIFYVVSMGGEAFLSFFDLQAGISSFLTDLPGLSASGLAVSPSGKSILYARTENQAGDLMFIPQFTP